AYPTFGVVMEMFADIFNSTLGCNPFNAMFSNAEFSGSEVTSMLQSGLFMSFISFCHYWELRKKRRLKNVVADAERTKSLQPLKMIL
ncbi:hypothetical protein Bhyg_02544, partial [Pseudolycoriella hygida]